MKATRIKKNVIVLVLDDAQAHDLYGRCASIADELSTRIFDALDACFYPSSGEVTLMERVAKRRDHQHPNRRLRGGE